MGKVGQMLGPDMNEFESAGAVLGIGVGAAVWVFVWLAVTGPSLIVYVLYKPRGSGRARRVQSTPDSTDFSAGDERL